MIDDTMKIFLKISLIIFLTGLTAIFITTLPREQLRTWAAVLTGSLFTAIGMAGREFILSNREKKINKKKRKKTSKKKHGGKK